MNNLKTTISGAITALFGTAALIATNPQLVSFLPAHDAGYVVGVCGLIAALSHIYGQNAAQDAPVKPQDAGTVPDDHPILQNPTPQIPTDSK